MRKKQSFFLTHTVAVYQSLLIKAVLIRKRFMNFSSVSGFASKHTVIDCDVPDFHLIKDMQ